MINLGLFIYFNSVTQSLEGLINFVTERESNMRPLPMYKPHCSTTISYSLTNTNLFK